MNTNQQEEPASDAPLLSLKIAKVDELYQVDAEVNGANGRALVLGVQTLLEQLAELWPEVAPTAREVQAFVRAKFGNFSRQTFN